MGDRRKVPSCQGRLLPSRGQIGPQRLGKVQGPVGVVLVGPLPSEEQSGPDYRAPISVRTSPTHLVLGFVCSSQTSKVEVTG